MDITGHIKKHIGSVVNTGARIYLVFRKLPDDPTHCLVIMADALPDQFFDNIYGLVMSREAQNTNELYEVLGRHTFADGGNVLQTLHEKGFLVKMPVAQVELIPLPGRLVALSIINGSIDGAPEATATPAASEQVQPLPEVVQNPADKAIDLIMQAADLETQARLLRKEAELLDPSPKPKSKAGRPSSGLTPEEKLAERNERRRASYAGTKPKPKAKAKPKR